MGWIDGLGGNGRLSGWVDFSEGEDRWVGWVGRGNGGGVGGSAGSCVDSKQTQTDMGVGKLMLDPVFSPGRGNSCCVEKTSYPDEASGLTQALPG